MAGFTNGLATVGRWQTYVGSSLAGAVILLFVAILVGVAWGQRNNKRTGRVQGTSANAVCSAAVGAPTCDGTVTYTVNGKQYTAQLQYPQAPGGISLWYNPDNPADVQAAGISSKVLLGVAVLLLVLLASVVANVFLVARSKTYAAFTGAGDLIGDLSRF